ncbi:hypothetical protein FSP39_020155 [Pinctada imbricata]|uniref:Uncharacterized protein n=1 Tax=Pinctada imbricata TaxID=66713 RepID=A0AA88YVB0_PINIB|nr:hypothetical protein FSP39_020155 [Pinctada imbricata]
MSLITLFLPQEESAELKYMKKKFAEVDANFDKVFNRLSEIKNVIQETALKNQFSDYESKIVILSHKLQSLLNAPTNVVDEYKASFIEAKKSSYDDAASVIFNGMIGKSQGFQYDIPQVAMMYTKNHRRRVQQIMSGGLSLILQGVKVELTYLSLTGRNHSYETKKKEWEERINEVLERMKQIDQQVVSKQDEQAKIDSVDLMSEYKDKSNAALADKMYSMLTEKYDWKLWFVVVYDPLHGADKHWVWYCGGFHKFRHHGKNIAVSSTEKDRSPLLRSCAETELPKTKTRMSHIGANADALPKDTYMGLKVDAKDVVSTYFPPEYKDCTAPGHGAILISGHPEFRGLPERYVVKDNNWYKLYVFQ